MKTQTAKLTVTNKNREKKNLNKIKNPLSKFTKSSHRQTQ